MATIAPNANLDDEFYAQAQLPWDFGTGQWHRNFNEQYGAALLPRYLASLGLSDEWIQARGYGSGAGGAGKGSGAGATGYQYRPGAGGSSGLAGNPTYVPNNASTLAQQLGYASAVPGGAPRTTMRGNQERFQMMQQLFNLEESTLAQQLRYLQTQRDLERQAALDQLRNRELEVRLEETGNQLNFNYAPDVALRMLLQRR